MINTENTVLCKTFTKSVQPSKRYRRNTRSPLFGKQHKCYFIANISSKASLLARTNPVSTCPIDYVSGPRFGYPLPKHRHLWFAPKHHALTDLGAIRV